MIAFTFGFCIEVAIYQLLDHLTGAFATHICNLFTVDSTVQCIHFLLVVCVVI